MSSDEEKETKKVKNNKTGYFAEFLSLTDAIAKDSSYSAKTQLVANFINKFTGDVYLLCKLLLCKDDKRVYNIKDKGLCKLLSRYWDCPQQELVSDLENGDASETAKKFLKRYGKPAAKSTLTLAQVDAFLDKLTKVTKEDDQLAAWGEILPLCTPDDLRMLWRIVDHDLRINIGPKFVLTAMHPDAWEAYKNSNDLRMVIDRIKSHKEKKDGDGPKLTRGTSFSTGVAIMTPIKPMLAMACKSIENLYEKCPNGAYAEIKYDGERIQIHKDGDTFKCFSRNLKPVLPHKLVAIEEFIPQSTKAKSIILDSEILLMDTKTRRPLPFGTLGVHKKGNFKEAVVCLFVFDILYLNGKPLLDMPIKKRRVLLEENVTVIPNRVELSELTIAKPKKQKEKNASKEDSADDPLKLLMAKVLKEGLEGLVVKDAESVYEPAARHWLKIKKDYLSGLADSADLIVLGAYFGTGNYGGMLSIFLVGVYDKKEKVFLTVCKIGNGFDEKTIHGFQDEMKKKMVKIEKDFSRVPDWLRIHRSLVPDYVAKDPKAMPVFEVAGAEFSISPTHTAEGISIRFPRALRVRKDKTWKEATDLEHLKNLVKSSVRSGADDNNDIEEALGVAGSKRSREEGDDEEDEDNNNNNSNKKQNKKLKKNENNNNNNSEDENENNNNNNNNNSAHKNNKNKITNDNDEDDNEDMQDILNESDAKVKKAKNDTKMQKSKEKGIIEILGDVTEPQGEPGNKMVVLCTDDTGNWGTKGIFASINSRWPTVSEEYKRKLPAAGTCMSVKVSDDSDGKQYVAVVVGQKVSTFITASEFNLKNFETAVAALSSMAQHKQCSIHMARLSPMIPKMDWEKVEKILVKYLVSKGIPTYVYSLQPVTPQAPKEKKKKKESTKKGKTANDDEDDEDDAPPSKGKKSDKNADKKSDKNADKNSDKNADKKSDNNADKKSDEKGDKKAGKNAPISPFFKQAEAKKPFELPSVFRGKVIYVHPSTENQAQLERYVIAYDGTTDSGLGDDVTHIVLPPDTSDSDVQEFISEHPEVHVVNPLWAWDCINTVKLRNESEYK